MSATAATRRADASAWRGAWGPSLAALAAVLASLVILLREEVAAAVGIWESSTAYNHCWLVLPVAGWLAWARRDRLASLAPQAMPALAPLALAPGLVWFVAERLGIMEGRQLAAIGLVWVACLVILGPRVVRAMAVPLGYLVFLVPFGAFVVPALQSVTAAMIGAGLGALGVPYHADGLVIATPAGDFLVAEACAGLRFLIAALAFGALYAATLFRSPGRRVAVMFLALVVPVVANGVRALGIVVLGQHLGSAEAAAADHVVYGWGFFSVVLLLLVLAGLPFRQDDAPPRVVPRSMGPGPTAGSPVRVTIAAVLVGGFAAAGPALGAALDGAVASPVTTVVALPASPGCVTDAEALRCGSGIVRAHTLTFLPRANWAAIAAPRRAAAGEGDEVLTLSFPAGGTTWDARVPPHGPATAVATWIGGQPIRDGVRARASRAWAVLRGEAASPVVAVLTLASDSPDLRVRAETLRLAVAAHGPTLARRGADASTGSRP